MKNFSLGALALLASLAASTVFAGTAPPIYDVPEPGTLALLALGVAGIAATRLRSRK
jgi:hypothetical protein